jgi:hypothetical protein
MVILQDACFNRPAKLRNRGADRCSRRQSWWRPPGARPGSGPSLPRSRPRIATRGYRQRIQAKPLTHDLGIKDVHGENLQSNHGDQDYPYTFLIDHSHASRQRREQSQEDSEIGNQADKAADNAEKIEIRDAEAPKHNSAEHCAYQANQSLRAERVAYNIWLRVHKIQCVDRLPPGSAPHNLHHGPNSRSFRVVKL